MKVSELGEFALIELLKGDLYQSGDVIIGPGDDTALVKPPAATRGILLTCDAMVEGVHFLPDTQPADVGFRLMAASISDIAAMGGIPRHALVSLVLPPATEVEWVRGLYRGMKECGEPFGVTIVGGDVCRGFSCVLSLALTGEVEPSLAMRRDQAVPGDIVLISGTLGGSRAGLMVHTGQLTLPEPLAASALARHLRPPVRVELGRMLCESGCRCANDISDGIASELAEIAAASSVKVVVNVDSLPVHEAAEAGARAVATSTAEYVLTSGEEYELLFTLAPHLYERLSSSLKDCTAIGRVEEGQGVRGLSGGCEFDLTIRGYRHFG